MTNRPRRYKRYLEEDDVEIPKRTRNRWKVTSLDGNVILEHDEQAGVQSEGDADTVTSDEDVQSEGDAVEDDPVRGNRIIYAPDVTSDSDEEDDFEDAVQELDEQLDLLHEVGDEATEESPPLYDGAIITEQLSTLAIMSFALRHSLSKAAVQNLLQLINIHLPVNCLPETFYMFSKNFDERTKEVDFHVYCKSCLGYLGMEEVLACTICDIDNLNRSDLIKEGFYFITLPLASQLKDIMETPSLHQYFVDEADRNVEIIWNCDGMPAFQSGKGSVWPIQCMVKALPPSIRKKHMLISGLWFGSSKPQFSTFLKPFIEECRQLSEDGVMWLDGIADVQHLTKFSVNLCACDSVARCQLQGISQFNGHFGCSWCLHEGKVLPKGRGHVMTYPFEYPPPKRRTQKSMEHQAIRLNSGMQPGEGVKHISPLLVLPMFDIVEGFPVDYMHAVCEGVSEHLLNLWCDRTNYNQAWFVGNSMTEIDERIANISPPNDITRLPRSPSQRAHWKASEFRSWTLFYCLPVLKGILPAAYLSHMLLLVHALWILLQETVTEEEISMCEVVLTKFVMQVVALYGAENMSYNMHLLLHLGDTVRNWGPLWSNSCFPFEGYNRKIKSLFHGTRYVQAQIAQNFTLLRILQSKVERLPVNSPPTVLKCIEGFLRGYPIIVKATSLTCDNCKALLVGNPCNYDPPLSVRDHLRIYFNVPVEDLILHKFSGIILNGRIFSVAKVTGRRKNCYISYDENRVGEIKAILRVGVQEGIKVALVLSEKRVKKCNFGTDRQTGANAGHICEISNYSHEIIVIRSLSVKFLKCVTARFGDKTFCMKLPNGIELD